MSASTLRFTIPCIVFALIFLICSSAHASLLAHYTFDEGSGAAAADSSGNQTAGSLSGPTWSEGRLAGGLHFDGNDDHVDLGSLDIQGTAATLMAWIYIDSFTGGSSDGRILSKADGVQEDDHIWMLSTIDSSGYKLRFRLNAGGDTTTLIGGTLTQDQWIHTAAVYDGSSMRLFIDGSEVSTVAKSGTIGQDNTLAAWVGDQPPAAGTRPWHGTIDDVRIYDHALSAAEIQLAMNNGNAFPDVTLLAPANNQQYSIGDTVPLSATASDSDGSIQVVEFYEGANKIGESATAPYMANWENVSEGIYDVRAKAIDNEGSSTYSAPVHRIIVGSGGTGDTWVHKSTNNGDLDLPTSTGSQQTASLTLDINGDGIDDFVITDRSTGPAVVWYQSSDSGSWQRHVVEPEKLPIEAGGDFTDIDGDGDLDIMFGGDGSSNQIWWWENPAPDFSSRWARRFIKNGGANKHHDQLFGDVDGDGQTELVSWNQGSSQLLLFEIPADPRSAAFWSSTAIASASSRHEGMDIFDVDGDDTNDIIGAGRWYRHTGGTGFDEHIVDTNQTFGRAAAGQFIPGGYAELVFGPGDNSGDLKFYRYDGAGNWLATTIKAGVDHGHSLHTADMNGDGHLDIFCAEMRLDGGNSDAKMWIFYGDGNGNFTESVVSDGIGNHESRPADLDGDGDIDILGKPYNWDAPRLDIWLNRGTGGGRLSLDMWQRHLIDGSMPDNSVFITAGDVDGDSHLDIIGGGWWWKNPGLPGGSWTRQTIGSELNNMAVVDDVDDDGDLDIIGTAGNGSSSSRTFRWAQNDGSGSFSILDNIDSGGSGDFLQGALVDDFGNGKEVVLSWHNGGGGVQRLSLPADPANETWAFDTLSTTTLSEDLSSGDIDRDGDNDLLLGTIWLENEGDTWTPHTIGQVDDLHSGAEPDRNDLADIDGDGRLDAVVALENGTSVLWFQAPENPEDTWQRNIIGTVTGGGFSMDVADFDNDSDIDVVVGEHRGSSVNRVLIFENQNNGDQWVTHQVDSDATNTIDHHDGTQAVDIDGDGDLDIISLGWYNKKVWLYENKAAGSGGSAPTITLHPANTTVTQGQRATFAVAASGEGALSYQWQRNGIDIPFATGTTLHTWPTSLGDTDTTYTCIVSSQYGTATSNAALLSVNPRTGSGGWWNTEWHYRLPVTIDPAGNTRMEFPASQPVNFTSLMSTLGMSGTFSPASIRVVEVNGTDAVINENVAFQFDPATDYNAALNASGELIFLLHGTTGPAENRYFHIYFDTAEKNHSPANVTPYISAQNNVAHKGYGSIRVDNQTATLFYHKDGGGFATLLDSEGNDWIGFKNDSGSDASGWYRGIPNAIYPEDMMHPGRSGCQTTLTAQGPLRVTIESTCDSWTSNWRLYPSFATMTMESVAHEYWFQYEGTPGGSTEATDFITLSDGTTIPASSELNGDITGSEWAYVGDANINRVIFAVHHQDDAYSDRFYRMEGGGGDGMTIFAFGRGSATDRFLTDVPNDFTIGLLETKDHSAAASLIEGITTDVGLTQGNVEGLASPTADTSEVYFGFVEAGTYKDQVITLSNSGSKDLQVYQIALSDRVQPPFFIINDTCSNSILSPGESCTITVRFSPDNTGDYSDSFDIATNGQPPSLTIYLHSGNGAFPWHMFVPIFSAPQ